ncbi:MAG TPA: class I SAM-dependent methyltransferase [Thermoanaerobaculia bacterium]
MLLEKRQVAEARRELRRRGLSCLSGPLPFRYLLRKLGVKIPAAVGYRIKSWDVLETVRYLEANLPLTAQILDLGANTSEILPILHRLGFHELTGVDLAPEVSRMPYADSIRYVQGDFMRTPFADGSFDALTSISAIEHGYDGDAAFGEAARLLRPDGHLIVSFDYWPEKIDTTGTLMYGMTWRIFSREEALELIATAQRHGFALVGEVDLGARDRVVQWGPWKYTFAWMAFRKRP